MKKGIIVIILCMLTFAIGCSGDTEGGDSSMEITGYWTGAIEIPNQPLQINVEFENEDDLTGVISIPAQGVQDYPLSSLALDGESIAFVMEMPGQSASFDGEVDAETIAGTFMQAGQSFPFELMKGEAPAADSEEEGEFLEVETDLRTLTGELETPDGDGPFPVMLIIPGSGPTDRNGNAQGINADSLKLVAEQLSEVGVASVRYGKRVAGKNQQAITSEEEMDFDQFVEDAKLWVELLHADENYTEVGIIGHSQGSLVGMLAAQESNVDAFVSIAGAGRSIDEVIYDQLRDQLPENLLNESEEILQQVKEGYQVEDISQELQSIFRPSVQPFLTSWMYYDPATEIDKLDIPTLLLNGERDIQVPVSEAETLHAAKDDSELIVIEKMNHVLKEAPEDRAGNMSTYVNPDLPLADGLMDGIVGFLQENAKFQF
ncbi:alpha/beta hydrolase [Virgibacillus sp. NKC19-16]|uniref:alpha/beta hydrolase family protein n=1 Tax=Virgibacillus salidurans TaxID=2831673 RepID=UPI001F1A7117|nr:alpha/beta hydrolase [Virgibacillus sp. NKC19-16]UJL46848.1 alpha/beta hydrolase [Virgibacillus sp. NKC19-16]